MAYTTLAAVRAAGVPTPPADGLITPLIPLADQTIDRITRQWFEPRAATIELDGRNSDTLFLPWPIISVTSLRINDSPDDLSTNLYRVYNARGGTEVNDDRKNPRIQLKREMTRDIYASPIIIGPMKFWKGSRNQRVVGTFGYTESDGTVPLLIQRAALLLVLQWITNPVYVPPTGSVPAGSVVSAAGPVSEEWTDGHKIKYATLSYEDLRPGVSGLIPNREVQDILKLYKGPMLIGAPAEWTVTVF